MVNSIKTFFKQYKIHDGISTTSFLSTMQKVTQRPNLDPCFPSKTYDDYKN